MLGLVSNARLDLLVLEDMPDTQKWLKDSCLLAFPDAQVSLCGSITEAKNFLLTNEPTLALLDIPQEILNWFDLLNEQPEPFGSCLTCCATLLVNSFNFEQQHRSALSQRKGHKGSCELCPVLDE